MENLGDFKPCPQSEGPAASFLSSAVTEAALMLESCWDCTCMLPPEAWLQVNFTVRVHLKHSMCTFRIVDFGPGTDVNYAFTAQSVMNPLGKSPPMCSEF